MNGMLGGMRTALLLATVLLVVAPARGGLPPPPPTAWADWPTTWNADDPGELSAEALLDKPAGRLGGVVVRDGHFYTGDRRVRFWGVNLAFGANFPAHDVADQLARRFARYGINAVRFHHMDNQPFPDGIFADAGLERLSPEALDRLDYFVAALKSRGVYADLNLHVSRNYNHYHRTADGKDGPRVEKVVDLFDPDLIAAQRWYAADLLGHVNAYTHARYADEPGVGLVEVNNENSLFMWGAEQKLAELPEPYAAELKRQWNGWLAKRYGTRDHLAAAWASPPGPAGPDLLRDPGHAAAWAFERHGTAAGSVADADRGVRATVSAVDGTAWHVQLTQGHFALTKGRAYHVRFAARAEGATSVGVTVGQGHDPWGPLGLYRSVRLTSDWQTVSFGFTATADDANARLSFALGGGTGTVDVADVDLHAGGAPPGLAKAEDLGTVATHVEDGPPARSADWVRFLADTEAAYYDGMRDHLHHDLGVRCPVTGTIGFGPMGTEVQSHQDFVDAHAYWQHPEFPRKPWDPADWTIANTPMVDQPAKATLWSLAATRVAGKPFTVTEYQHPAPSDWQAECIPEIATFAALQDWDGVFLFAYSHDAHYDKGRIASFFDIEGNPTKMPLMPIGARLFLGGAVPALADGGPETITPRELLAGAVQTDMAAFLRSRGHEIQFGNLFSRFSVRFGGAEFGSAAGNGRIPWWVDWTDGNQAGTGQFQTVAFPSATASIGFRLGHVASPYAALCVVPSDPSKPIASADRLLVTAVARARNTDQQWNAARTSVGTHWGHGPTQIEVVHADVTVPGRWSHAWALDPAGKRTAVDVAEPAGGDTVLHLGRSAALGYLVVR